MTKADEAIRSKWMTTKDAAKLLTEKSEHAVSDAYVRRMGLAGRITVWEVDDRTRLYLRSDIEKITVAKRGDGSVRRAARAKKPRITKEREAEAVA